MILSHKHRFIFIKTKKTAGTSIELFLSQFCGPDDIVTPLIPVEAGHVAQNAKGLWWPNREIREGIRLSSWPDIKSSVGDLVRLRRFYNHLPAWRAQMRITQNVWNSYYKFCVDRNPLDKTLSHYYMRRAARGGLFDLETYFCERDFCLNAPRYTDRTGSLMVDRILQYETLENGLGEVCQNLGIPWTGSLKHRAKTSYRTDRSPPSEIFTNEQINTLRSVFRDEVTLSGYEAAF